MSTVMLPLCPSVGEAQLPVLLRLLTEADTAEEITLDLGQVRWWMPGAVLAVFSRVQHWHREKRVIRLINYQNCEAFRYLQRIDFFEQLGIHLPEDFHRRDCTGRFLPIRQVGFGSGGLDRIATELAQCVMPGADWNDDTYQLVQYVAGEILSNAVQHSGGVAWVSAQYFPKGGLVRVAVADNGGGILESFKGTPLYRPEMTEEEAVRKALEAGVSSGKYRISQYGRSHNRGLGLSVVDELARQSLGHLQIVSKAGWRTRDMESVRSSLCPETRHPGTLVCAAFQRDQVHQYREMHRHALTSLGLHLDAPDDIFG